MALPDGCSFPWKSNASDRSLITQEQQQQKKDKSTYISTYILASELQGPAVKATLNYILFKHMGSQHHPLPSHLLHLFQSEGVVSGCSAPPWEVMSPARPGSAPAYKTKKQIRAGDLSLF